MVIVGLGNPGLRYGGTRHNVGFMALDLFASRTHARVRRRWCRSLVGDARISGREFILAKPQTFMNASGEAVREILMRSKTGPPDLLVICDDVNLPLGTIRLRARGSAGGHHGLESIIHCLHSSDFARLRIGIGEGRNGRDVIPHVLGRFHKSEQKRVDEVLARSVDCVELLISDGIEAAMNAFN